MILFILGAGVGLDLLLVFCGCHLSLHDFLMYNGEIEGLFLFIFVGFLGIASVCIFSTGNSEKVYSHEEYKVIIDDSVSLNDFYKKYEVIGQEGEIYTVIEREQG